MEEMRPIVNDLRPALTDMLTRWVSIPSVKAAPKEGAPFGPDVRRMLDVALDDAKALGFAVREIDGYAGDVRMGPLGTDPLGILVHLDVVPAGDGWQTDPFEAVVEGDRLYGRGASDDKGPAVAALLAMYAIKKAGIPLKREVRLILGCDEETGMGDMKYYAAHCDMPQTGFSPDASFPLINTEKGLVQLELKAAPSKDGLKVRRLWVGERPNVIPGLADALIEGNAALCEKVRRLAKDMDVQVTAEPAGEGLVKLVSTGIPGHAAYPEAARNAIGQLLLMLSALGVTGPLLTLANCVGLETDGLSLGVRCQDETSGSLTCNLGILHYDEKGLYAVLDFRFPLLTNGDRMLSTACAALGDAFSAAVLERKEPHHVPPQSALVTALLDAYHEETGRERKCIAIGGGTYARCLGEGVAFGSAFPEDEELAHQAGEYASLDGLMQNVSIFVNAIVKLAGA